MELLRLISSTNSQISDSGHLELSSHPIPFFSHRSEPRRHQQRSHKILSNNFCLKFEVFGYMVARVPFANSRQSQLYYRVTPWTVNPETETELAGLRSGH